MPQSNRVQDEGFRVSRTLRALHEDRPSHAMRVILRDFWPGWRRWFERHGGSGGTPQEAARALRLHMPEIVPTLERIAALRPEDDLLREFLSFWSPPRYLTGCSQAASSDWHGPFVIRNYDLDPAKNEFTLLQTGWRGKRVIGMLEGIAGLSDGMNQDGLVASVAFGGRIALGRGFGVPLIMRYLLEVCTDVPQAVEALRAIPCHMAYNLILADRSGRAATAFIGPDRPAIVRDIPWCANHQIGIEWPQHARVTATMERAQVLETCFAHGQPDEAALRHVFASPPVHATRFAAGFGTLFTSLYRPAGLTMNLIAGGRDFGAMPIAVPASLDAAIEFTAHAARIATPSHKIEA